VGLATHGLAPHLLRRVFVSVVMPVTTNTSPAISLNHEQRLYVITRGDFVSCRGFDSCLRDAQQMAALIGTNVESAPESIDLFHEHGRLAEAFAQHPASQVTYFMPGTHPDVKRHLEWARRNDVRIAIDLGDSNTGRLWGDCDKGYVSRSKGPQRVPLLVRSKLSSSGGAILTDSILRIRTTKDNALVWEHPALRKVQLH